MERRLCELGACEGEWKPPAVRRSPHGGRPLERT
jgi:hypothetical protein